jgi:hypothetical protein
MWQVSTLDDGKRRFLTPQAFEAEFIKLCAEHRESGQALAFAFILHRASHAHVGLVLDSDRYWRALDELSGRYLTVFSFNTPSPRTAREPQATAYTVSEMVSVEGLYRQANPFQRHFASLDLSRLPCVVFFQVDGDSVAETIVVAVKSKGGTEAVYEELFGILETAVAAIARVTPENAKNGREILWLIGSALQTRVEKKLAVAVIKRTVPVVAIVARIAAMF